MCGSCRGYSGRSPGPIGGSGGVIASAPCSCVPAPPLLQVGSKDDPLAKQRRRCRFDPRSPENALPSTPGMSTDPKRN